MRPAGKGASDTWSGSATTWLAPLPMTLNSEKGNSGGRSTGCGVNFSRTMSRTSPEIRDTSAPVRPVPAAAVNWILLSFEEGRTDNFRPDALARTESSKAARTSPCSGWSAAAICPAPESGS
jgi:hypothetical protein